MKQIVNIKPAVFILFLVLNFNSFAQDEDAKNNQLPTIRRKSKFLTGFYLGSYFANKYSASTYNGYGFDVDGNQNSFLNSFMYQKIMNEYGGGFGGYDRIAEALGVDQNQWVFSESDMPVNMRYVPGLLVGLNFKLPVDRKSAIIVNVNGSVLGIEGNFTITTLRPVGANPANNTNIKTFPIKGKEQRLLFELGFQRILGDDDKLNFFAELGFIGTLAKFDQNTIYINDLQIDLTNYLNQTAFAAPGPTRKPVGFGVGAFLGAGANLDINPKFTLQLLYSPSYEKINFGNKPTLKWQNGVGLRVYYNF